MITAELADGRRLEFPDGTDPSVIQATVKRLVGERIPAPAAPKPETTVLGVAGEVGKGLLRGPSDVATMVGKAGANMMLGPVVGKVAEMGIERLSAPSRKLVTATPQTDVERFAGTIAEILGAGAATGGLSTVPSAVMTGASALGGATGEQIGGQTGKVIGSLVPAAGAVASIPIGAGYRLGRNLIDPALPGGTERSAARGLSELLGTRRGAVEAELRAPQVIVPGSNPTAAEAAVKAGSTELAGAQKLAAQRIDPSGYRDIEKTQEAARLANISSFAKDKMALSDAVARRGVRAESDYDAAFSRIVRADPELARMSRNPYFKRALAPALDLAKAAEISPKTDLTHFLHFVKLGLDDQLSGTAREALGRSERHAVSKLKDQLVEWLARKNPAYEFARGRFEAASRPIAEMEVGQKLAETMRQPTELGERAASFATVMREPSKAIKAATGFSKENLDEVLTPDNMTKVNNVLADMLRKREFEQMATKGAPRATEIMKAVVPELPPTGWFQPIVSAARSWINRAAGVLDRKALTVMSEALKTPEGTLRLMERMPPELRREFYNQARSAAYRASLSGAAASYEK